MRILILHNRYRRPGGEDAVVAREAALLAAKGHEVARFEPSNEEIGGLGAVLMTALEAPYSRAAAREVAARIAAFRPHIVHVHNFFPRLTPAVYDACRAAGVPVVQTLHNYRLLCANALLLRDGQPCELCVAGSPYRAVRYRCYRGSALASVAVARMIAYHRRAGTWSAKVDRFIALTRFAKARFVAGGVPEARIAVKPNFVPDPGRPPAGLAREGALYVGRLSAEKGVAILIEAWRGLDVPLRIVGEGPEEARLRSLAPPAVRFLGRLAPGAVAAEMRRARVLLAPSLAYESFPLVLAEAFANGLPVIVTGHGAMGEIVTHGVNGLHVPPGNAAALAEAASEALAGGARLARMGEAARRTYETALTPGAAYEALMTIYRAAVRAAAPSP